MKTIWKVVIIVIIVALPLVFWGNIKNVFMPASTTQIQQEGDNSDKKSGKKEKKDKKGKKDKKKKDELISSEVKLIDQWSLPPVLTEISGIEYLGNNRFACIQDEDGKIFIYDASQKKVLKEIPFGGAGDYEDIAIVESTAYVVRSDGRLFEVSGFEGAKPSVKEYPTPLTDHDIEGLCYDKKNNRLLLAIKGEEPGNKDYKGIYSFDLASRKLAVSPAIKIDLADPVFGDLNEKKSKNNIQPSGVEINPVTGQIYVIEGASPKVLIMDESGKMQHLYQMSTSEFQQAEGITFTPEGDLYISNEGKNGDPNILKVEIGK